MTSFVSSHNSHRTLSKPNINHNFYKVAIYLVRTISLTYTTNLMVDTTNVSQLNDRCFYDSLFSMIERFSITK